MIACRQEGHVNKQAKYLCIYQECNKQRLSCDICLNKNIHNHNKDEWKYFILTSSFLNIISAYFIKNNITVNYDILNEIIKNQIIIIDEANDDYKIQKKQTLHKMKNSIQNIVFSNNKRLMVTWALDEKVRMWHNLKLINKMEDFILFNVGIFSEDDLYFFIGNQNIIEILDVQQNFKLLEGIQLGSNEFQGCGGDDSDDFVHFQFINKIKVITNKIVLVTISENIYRVDFNQNKISLKLTLLNSIRSLDYQKKRQIILSYSDVICLWDSFGNLILQNNGGVLQNISEVNYSSYSSIIANFIGDQDRIITVNSNSVIIWFIDYHQRILRLDKIIQSPSLIYLTQLNLQKNQINLFRQSDLLTLSLTDYKNQAKKHTVKIRQSLAEANYFSEIIIEKNIYQLKLKKLIAIRSSFNKLISIYHL